MINVYKKDETDFNHNQFVLKCSSCFVTEEINERYEIDIECPGNDSISNEITEGAYIKVPSFDEREDQLFILRKVVRNIDLNIKASGQCAAIAKLGKNKNLIKDTNIVNKTRKQALQQILSNTLHPHKFIVGNKDLNTKISSLRPVRLNPIEAIIGDKENTILNNYGGEIRFDNFTIDVVDQLGNDKGIIISHAKNVTGAELTKDDTDIVTEIVPEGKDGIFLPEYSIKASNFEESNPFVEVIKMDYGVVEAKYDENGNCTNTDDVCTLEKAYDLMRKECKRLFEVEHINEIPFNLKLNFLEPCDLIEGNEYTMIKEGRVSIGDFVTVIISPLNINLHGRIFKIKRDVLTGRLIEAEIGFKKKNIIDSIKDNDKKIESTDKKLDETKQELKEDIEQAENETNNLKITMEKRADSIELSVKNETKERESAIELLDGKIEERVTSKDFSSYKTQTDREISQKISKGTEFSSEMKQNVSTFQFLFNDASSGKTEIDATGITVYQGGFKIKDKNGNTILRIDNDGTVVCENIGVNDISIYDRGKGSMFYNSIANMTELYCKKYSCDRLFIDGTHIYDYIVDVLQDKGLV